MLYTKDKDDAVNSFNLIGAEDNILSTARTGEGDAVDFYTYTKDLRESTINVVGKDGISQKTYSYTDYGETTEQGENDFYNEICYGGGIYDKTTGLYYLNARYYSPENGSFLTQDTYRGSRSKTETLNLYGYCAGNPISYTDPSGHWIWGVVGAAMGAYDGYKYAKKKGYKGWNMYASIAGGAALGAVNPFKIFKMAKSGYKAYKAVKYTKKARNVYKKTKSVVKVRAKPKPTVVAKKQVKSKAKARKVKKGKWVVKKQTKKIQRVIKTKASAKNKPKYLNTTWYKNDGSINYPPNNGAVRGTEKKITLKTNTVVGRFGEVKENSKFVTQTGVDPEKLSLPPDTDPASYSEFIVTKPIPNVTQAEIAPWGDSPGGGIQYLLPRPIKELEAGGYLRKLNSIIKSNFIWQVNLN